MLNPGFWKAKILNSGFGKTKNLGVGQNLVLRIMESENLEGSQNPEFRI